MVSGKEFRSTLKKPIKSSKYEKGCRYVPAFTIESLQKGNCVIPPPRVNVFKERPPRHHRFRQNYMRGNLPIALDPKGKKVSWKADVSKLDFHYYLPMFFEGLTETQNPYKLFAKQGIYDMLMQGGAQKVFPCIPQLIIPIKQALSTRNKEVMINTLEIIQHLVKTDNAIGEALVPYYRQILPSLNIFKELNVNCGDAIDESQKRGENLADVINTTLTEMETRGGEDAFINIKYLIPTYESCMLN